MARESVFIPVAESREVPVGRTALWWCLGLGGGMSLGEVIRLLAVGTLGLPEVAETSRLLFTALAVWPWMLALTAAALLLAGMRPAGRVAIDRRTAAHVRRSGAPAVAKVVRASDPSPGQRALMEATLLVRTRAGRMFPTDVRWVLDPVDAQSVSRGAVIPVRLDPGAPHCAVLDTQADSRAYAPGVDLDSEFSARRRIHQLVSRVRWSSKIALTVGAVAGVLVVTL